MGRAYQNIANGTTDPRHWFFINFFKPINECKTNLVLLVLVLFGKEGLIHITILTIPCYICDKTLASKFGPSFSNRFGLARLCKARRGCVTFKEVVWSSHARVTLVKSQQETILGCYVLNSGTDKARQWSDKNTLYRRGWCRWWCWCCWHGMVGGEWVHEGSLAAVPSVSLTRSNHQEARQPGKVLPRVYWFGLDHLWDIYSHFWSTCTASKRVLILRTWGPRKWHFGCSSQNSKTSFHIPGICIEKWS